MDKVIHFKIKRQDGPNSQPYWEEFKMPYAPQHNVISALLYLREHPVNTRGQRVAPVAWESNCMEEVCGACSMLVNGVPRQACAALVDDLEQPIVLEPLTKFPIIRDLAVDRQKMFDALASRRGCPSTARTTSGRGRRCPRSRPSSTTRSRAA